MNDTTTTTVRPITADYLRQVRILLEESVSGYSRDTVASLVAALDEMTRCRDNAVRAAEREDVPIEFDLEGNLRDGLAGIAEWRESAEPDQAPDWLIDAVVRVVRPELARLTQERDLLAKQSPGQGVLPVETAGSATPAVTIVHNGAGRALPWRPGDSLGEVFAAACDAFDLAESERRRLGLFNGGGVQIDTDVALGHVKPGDVLTLRPRIVRA